MILIYSRISSPRLQYVCKFIFKEQLGIAYSLTTDTEGFKDHDGPKINYSDAEFKDPVFNIPSHSLLFESGIREQRIECFKVNNYTAFFKSAFTDVGFDLFAATFYLLSRYEEYLPHEKDLYNRYSHENALAFKEGFLQIPLINIWIQDFAKSLQKKYPNLNLQSPGFKFIPTYDIDIAWSYKNKGFWRNLGGFLRLPTIERLIVLTGFKKDPFNSYDFMDMLHAKNKLEPIYFFLVATTTGIYDKNISPYTNGMWQLIKQHAKKYAIGLHPSWKSYNNLHVLKKEKKILETAGAVSIKNSRQHYIKFTFPQTFENLLEAGIENDYSMGYGSINGFRASVASSFYWYNLHKEELTTLRLHPFCYMDANSFYEQRLHAEEAYDEMLHYYTQCKKVGGTFISIFHNHFLGTEKQLTGWREIYTRFISQLQQ